jgi:hypothetical protein
LYTNAFEQTKIEGNLISKVEVTGPLLAGLPLKKTGANIFKPKHVHQHTCGTAGIRTRNQFCLNFLYLQTAIYGLEPN